jgi:hypothetical protein
VCEYPGGVCEYLRGCAVITGLFLRLSRPDRDPFELISERDLWLQKVMNKYPELGLDPRETFGEQHGCARHGKRCWTRDGICLTTNTLKFQGKR